ncbi:unnamed protein product, partial [Ectocarpus sp. 13 AM-2016]
AQPEHRIPQNTHRPQRTFRCPQLMPHAFDVSQMPPSQERQSSFLLHFGRRREDALLAHAEILVLPRRQRYREISSLSDQGASLPHHPYQLGRLESTTYVTSTTSPHTGSPLSRVPPSESASLFTAT